MQAIDLRFVIVLIILLGGIFSEFAFAANIRWTGNALNNDNWNNTANWDSNIVPTEGDDVTIGLDDTGAAPSVVLNGVSAAINSLSLTHGLLTVFTSLSMTNNSSVSLGASLNHRSGTLSPVANLNVDGTFTWTGGTLAGAGALLIASGGSLIMDGSSKILQGLHIVHNSTTNNSVWSSGIIFANSGAVIDNSGNLQIQTDSFLQFSNGGSDMTVVNNSGTIVRNSSSGNSTALATLVAIFNNSGSVDLQVGTLRLSAGGTNTGTFNIAADAVLEFSNGTYDIDMGGIPDSSGSVKFSGGTTNINASSVVNSVDTVVSGTANFLNDTGLTTVNLSQIAGVLTGNANFDVSGIHTWTGGTLSGSGELRIPAGASLVIDVGGTKNWIQRKIVHASTTGNSKWLDGIIYVNGGAVFENSGTFYIQEDGLWQYLDDGTDIGVINNSGTIIRDTVSADVNALAVLIATFNNSGTVDVQSGILRLYNGGTSTGIITIAADGLLDFANGTYNIDMGGIPDSSGNVRISGGTVNINGTSIVNLVDTQVLGGTVNFVNETGLTTVDLNQTGGTLTGSANIDVSGTYTWGGGTLSGTGELYIPIDGTLELNGVAKTLRGRNIIHDSENGNSVWTSGIVYANTGAVFENNGVFHIQADNAWQYLNDGSESGFINNNGTLIRNANTNSGDGIVTLVAILNNTGTFDIQTGNVRLYQGGTSSGIINVAATLEIVSGDFVFGPTRNLTGDGIVNFGIQNTTFVETRPQVSTTDTFVADNGPITINSGSITQPANGSVVFDGTNMSYDPQGFSGTESFSYVVNGTQGSAAATVTYTTYQVEARPLRIQPPNLSLGRVGQYYHVDLMISGGVPPYSLELNGGLPSGLTFDSINRIIKGSPTQAGVFEFVMIVNDSNLPSLSLSKSYNLTIEEQSDVMKISNTSLPDGVVGAGYGVQLNTTGGVAPFTWRVLDTLPQDLELDYTGYLSGVLAKPGEFIFDVEVSDAQDTKTSASMQFHVLAEGLQNKTPSLPDAIVGQLYETPLLVSGGIEPYHCASSIDLGIWGFSLNECVIRGRALEVGSLNFGIEVTDSHEPALALQIPIDISIRSAVTGEESISPVINSKPIDLGSIDLDLGSGKPGKDFPDEHLNAMTTDAFGYVYVVGYAFNGNDYALHTMKLATDGRDQALWHRVLDTTSHDYGYGVVVAPDQSVYVGGYYLKGNVYTGLLIKYDSQGILQWQKAYETGQQVDTFYALTADESGVYAAGERYSGQSFDAHIVKFNTQGQIEWETTLASDSNSTAYGIAHMQCTELELDPCPIAVGGAEGTKKRNAWLAFINPLTGDEQGVQTVIPNAVIEDIETDSNGYAYLGFTTSDSNMGVLKFNHQFEQQWIQPYSNEMGEMRLRAVEVDLTGTVYGIGSQENGTDQDIQIIVYDNQGTILGNQQLDEGQDEIARGAVIDANQNLIISGESQGSQGSSFLIRRYPTGYSQ